MIENGSNRFIELLRRDIFAIIWVVFLIIIIYLTFHGKEYIKDMITVSILFLAFLIIEPMIRLAHGSKITKFISRGKEVPYWKRFPLFLVALLILFAIERGLEIGIEEAFPTESVNIVLVAFWLLSLFLFYYLIYSQLSSEPEELIPTKKKNNRIRYNFLYLKNNYSYHDFNIKRYGVTDM